MLFDADPTALLNDRVLAQHGIVEQAKWHVRVDISREPACIEVPPMLASLKDQTWSSLAGDSIDVQVAWAVRVTCGNQVGCWSYENSWHVDGSGWTVGTGWALLGVFGTRYDAGPPPPGGNCPEGGVTAGAPPITPNVNVP